jgi:biopolymer transport protein ExbB/TolQ
MKALNQFLHNLGKSPFLWGLLGSAGFYGLIHGGPLGFPLVIRYFTHHPVEYMETVLFSVGLAALIVKALDTFAQRTALAQSPLGAKGTVPFSGRRFASVPENRDSPPAEDCAALLARLDRLPASRQGEYFITRLRAAIEHVSHRGTAEGLDDELKYLSDLDASRLHAGYGLFRVIVWAIPILGFLGTVIGITMMLTGAAQMATGSDQSSMFKVFEGLGLKFDTTALALTLSMVLMFIHFFVERAENALLEQVDRAAARELADRFAAIPAGADGQLAAVRRMAETMLHATEVLVQRQAELWHASMESAAARWTQMADAAGEQLARAIATLQAELGRHADVLQRAVEASGEIARLEDTLNRNLTALAGAKHFEQTVLSLAAAINLLGARLAETPGTAIKLETPRRTALAA